MITPRDRGRIVRAAGALLLAFAAGCSTPRPMPARESAFYPPAPAEPRLQLLTTLSTDADLGRPTSRWWRFLVGPPAPSEPIVKPYGVAISGSRLLVCDTVSRSLAVFDLARRRLTAWRPGGEGRLSLPVNLAADADGTLYVADPSQGRVMIYSAAGTYQGSLASASGLKPTAVAVSSNHAYVVDLNRRAVVVFDKATRTELSQFPRDDAAEAEQLFSPVNIALGPDGRIYVSDLGGFRVQQYDPAGRLLGSLGTAGDAPGQFARPKGLATDRAGRLYVVDAAAQVVQIFDPEGRLLLFFGEPQPGAAEMNLPAGIAIDYENVDFFRPLAAPGFTVEYLVLVTNQYGEHKVNVYGFGHTT